MRNRSANRELLQSVQEADNLLQRIRLQIPNACRPQVRKMLSQLRNLPGLVETELKREARDQEREVQRKVDHQRRIDARQKRRESTWVSPVEELLDGEEE